MSTRDDISGGSFCLDEYYARTNALFKSGNPALLEKHHFVTVKQLEEMGAQDTPAAASVYNEVACWLRGVSRYEESLGFYERSLAIMESCGDECADMENRVRLNLATLYRLMGDLGKAQELFDRLCQELASGADRYAYVSALNNFALVYQDRGQFQRALELYDRVLEVLPGCPNVDEHELATTYANMAGAHMRMGNLREAEAAARDAIAIFDSMRSEDSHLASAQTMLGSILYMEGEFEEASGAFERALNLNLKYYGRNVDYARIAQSLARAREKTGDRKGALDMQRSAVDALSALPDSNEDLMRSYRAYLDVLAGKKGEGGHE